MTATQSVDGVLVQWGERLFYPGNRIVRPMPPVRLDVLARRKAGVIRARIVSTVARRAPQVMVKVTGGGRGMKAIAAHFRYISKNGQLQIEDERGVMRHGKEAVFDLVEQWRYGGSRIEEIGHRREAFNLMLSMPQGTDPRVVQHAARLFVQAELRDHSVVMVLHEHQANPHVHLAVRAESRFGQRLNPRKADLHRWRETFAENLRSLGIEAEATRQPTRGVTRGSEALWRLKARAQGRLHRDPAAKRSGDAYRLNRLSAIEAWAHIAKALEQSDRPDDRRLSREISRFVGDSPFAAEWMAARRRDSRAMTTPLSRDQASSRGLEPGR